MQIKADTITSSSTGKKLTTIQSVASKDIVQCTDTAILHKSPPTKIRKNCTKKSKRSQIRAKITRDKDTAFIRVTVPPAINQCVFTLIKQSNAKVCSAIPVPEPTHRTDIYPLGNQRQLRAVDANNQSLVSTALGKPIANIF